DSPQDDMYYTRGASSDFDRYANETGDPGWSWDNLQPYIRKNEIWTQPADHHNTTGEFNPSVHGFNGTNAVSLAGYPQGTSSRIIQTTQELADQFPFNEDMNSGKPLGLGWLQATIKGANRSSSATSYLAPHVLSRRNLHVVVNTQVTRILETEGAKRSSDKSCHPVLRTIEIAQNSTSSKEVILSSGFIGTPQILLNSGIGNATELRNLKIKSILDLPGVGKNLTDMPALPNVWQVNSTDTFDDIQRDPQLRAQYLNQWSVNGTGPLVLTTASHLIYRRVPSNSTVFEEVPDPSSGENAPHYEIFTVNGAFGATPPEGHYMSLVSIVVNPASRGSITLNSSNPFEPPLIDTASLTSPFDRFALSEAVKASSLFLTAPVWKDYVIGPVGALANVTNDDELNQYILDSAVSALHGVGTAAMSAKNASHGVVDPDLLLKGASGLRIVDASIFPHMPAAHVQAPIYIIAERGADLIKKTWTKA
ncbi:hypothetical protein H0H93_008725, partial [Arthromyces matolae]